LLGWYYLDAGDTTRAVQFFEERVDEQPNNLDLRFRLAGIYERTGQIPEALAQLEAAIVIDPNNRDAMMAAVGISVQHNMVQKARQFLTEWLRRHPGDTVALETLEDINRQLQAEQPPEEAEDQ
jgi:tetratricopeptide (TPR) repeat protein